VTRLGASSFGRSALRELAWPFAIVLFWTIAIGLSIGWNLYQLEHNLQQRAYSQADASLQKDMAYREVIARAGGIYVTTESGIAPNPYLDQLATRDVVTESGKQLTLVNSSYFVRLVHDIEASKGKNQIRGHVTSHFLLRKENRPDAWESAALDAFARGVTEVKGFFKESSGEEFFRLMRPRIATPGCFSCHINTPLQSGDVLGGVSVTVPLQPLQQAVVQQQYILVSGHLALWLIGIAGSVYAWRRNRRQNELLVHLAYHDDLTNLPNRFALIDRLHTALQAARQMRRHGGLLLLDLDRFKYINDSLGHTLGDALLQESAQRLSDCCPATARVARIGGDEFAVLLAAEFATADEAKKNLIFVAEQVRELLNQVYSIGAYDLHISPSIGAVLYPDEGETPEELLRHADAAMYQAKAGGRNRISHYLPTLQQMADKRLDMEKELRKAVYSDGLDVYYQPQIDHRRQICGFEALVRWPHPQRGMISPSEFIPIAEEIGLILPLGDWVLRRACEQFCQWMAQGILPAEATLSVNVSVHQFYHHDFVKQIMAVIEACQMDPARLKLEITESVVIDDIGGAIEKIEQLRRLGLRFSLDDFGTGYSSLSYLNQLPLYQLKIDRSFIHDLQQGTQDTTLVETIIGMCDSLKLSVVAEGVEHETQFEYLLARGCREFQGFLFYRPLPAAQVTELLMTQKR
jgi:diguanylate cyclase (GGDEF)-like protein